MPNIIEKPTVRLVRTCLGGVPGFAAPVWVQDSHDSAGVNVPRFLTHADRRLGRGGIHEIHDHPAFVEVNWSTLATGKHKLSV